MPIKAELREKFPAGVEMISLGACVCGSRISVPKNRDLLAVGHDLPMCPKFLELEPDEFLTYVRRSRGIPDQEAIH